MPQIDNFFLKCGWTLYFQGLARGADLDCKASEKRGTMDA